MFDVDPINDFAIDAPGFAFADQPEVLFGNQCKLWGLRAVLNLGGHQNVLDLQQCKQPQLVRYFGIDPEPAAGEYDHKVVMQALKDKKQELELSAGNDLSADIPLIANLRWFAQQVGLNQHEQLILLFRALVEKDPHLGAAMDTLNGLDMGRLYTTLSVVLDIPLRDVMHCFDPNGGFARTHVLSIDDNRSYNFVQKLEINNGLLDGMLMQHDDLFDLFANSFVVAQKANLQCADFAHLEPKVGHLKALLKHVVEQHKTGVNVLVYGPPGTGKTELVRALAQEINAKLFEVAVEFRHGKRITGKARLSAYKMAQSVLARHGQSVILFDEIEDINIDVGEQDELSRSDGSTSIKGWFNKLLEQNAVPAIWVSNDIRGIDSAHVRRFDYHLFMDIPPKQVRAGMLASQVQNLGASAEWCELMAANDALSPAISARAAKVVEAMQAAGIDAPVEGLLDEVIEGALTAQRRPLLPKNGNTTQLNYRLASANADCKLDSVIEGLRRNGEGRLCLYGPPGTGKSAFALHVAEKLGKQPLLQRASDILGSLVGQTEARMAAMFKRADKEGSLLILDEADSFLHSRTGARSNWEVTAVNEMLTQMENFKGIFFATTNMLDRLDAASLRRFDLKVFFNYLNYEQCEGFLVDACASLGFECSDGARSRLQRLRHLTPGDFANVVRQSRYRPIEDSNDLIGRLAGEEQLKKLQSSNPIGFIAPMAA